MEPVALDDSDGGLVEFLKRLRTKRGLSLLAVAILAGTTATSVHRWEHGRAKPDYRKWASAFGLRLALVPV